MTTSKSRLRNRKDSVRYKVGVMSFNEWTDLLKKPIQTLDDIEAFFLALGYVGAYREWIDAKDFECWGMDRDAIYDYYNKLAQLCFMPEVNVNVFTIMAMKYQELLEFGADKKRSELTYSWLTDYKPNQYLLTRTY